MSAVEAAKAAATAKGAKAVGALKSEEFSSLTSGSYVIYSGVYHTARRSPEGAGGAEEQLPLGHGDRRLERLLGVTRTGQRTRQNPAGWHGQQLNKPAPPSVLEGLHNSKGKSYVEKSKALPNVVETS